MPEDNDPRESPLPVFRTVTFGGYARAEIDAYMDDVARAARRDREEMGALRMRIADLEARYEAVQQDSALKVSQLLAELEEARAQARAIRDESDRARVDLDRLDEELKGLKVEKEGFQRLAERLASEEAQTKEIIKAAVRAAEDVRSTAGAEAEQIMGRAEDSARRAEDEARRRVDELKREYERTRKEYDDFLKDAREVAQGLVRRIDDARSKWPA